MTRKLTIELEIDDIACRARVRELPQCTVEAEVLHEALAALATSVE